MAFDAAGFILVHLVLGSVTAFFVLMALEPIPSKVQRVGIALIAALLWPAAAVAGIVAAIEYGLVGRRRLSRSENKSESTSSS